MTWFIILAVLMLGLVVGYIAAMVTGTPLLAAWHERQRIEHERRLAELQLHHLSQQAMQRLIREARSG
jgi:hypothetical protein